MAENNERDGVVSPEVNEKPVRRRFTAKYKTNVLAQADRCTEPGQIGELLRREGLYSSHLANWRSQRDEGLSPKKRGRKTTPNKKEQQELMRLQRENQRLAERLRQAELIIDVQKKVSQMLGIPMAQTNVENDE